MGGGRRLSRLVKVAAVVAGAVVLMAGVGSPAGSGAATRRVAVNPAGFTLVPNFTSDQDILDTSWKVTFEGDCESGEGFTAIISYVVVVLRNDELRAPRTFAEVAARTQAGGVARIITGSTTDPGVPDPTITLTTENLSALLFPNFGLEGSFGPTFRIAIVAECIHLFSPQGSTTTSSTTTSSSTTVTTAGAGAAPEITTTAEATNVAYRAANRGQRVQQTQQVFFSYEPGEFSFAVAIVATPTFTG